MIQSFVDQGTEDIFDGVDSKRARSICPAPLHQTARRKLEQLNAAASLDDMRAPPGNRLEKLKGELGGLYSVRINEQYRVCFRWARNGPEEVRVVDYH